MSLFYDAVTASKETRAANFMRRFTFKLQFDYLEAEGKRTFFERMFRTVRQSLYYLGGSVTNETRLNELEKESSLKKGTSRRVGF